MRLNAPGSGRHRSIWWSYGETLRAVRIVAPRRGLHLVPEIVGVVMTERTATFYLGHGVWVDYKFRVETKAFFEDEIQKCVDDFARRIGAEFWNWIDE